MKCSVLFIEILIFGINFSSGEYVYNVNYVDVPVDHFSFTNNATFKLRYLINSSYWNNDGPIFFYTGNEGDINTFAQNSGFIWEIAPSFKALIVFCEHRYYGTSLPFGDKSFSDPIYVGYLHSAQALADFVYVIDHIQTLNGNGEDDSKNPVIAFGGSYGGMLSSWLRMKYPSSVLGAVASSAPILQFETPCDVFSSIVTSVFRTSSETNDCADVIKKSWSALRNVTGSAEGRQWLTKTWKLCDTLKDNDVEVLFNWLQDVYGNLAMVNYPYPTSFLSTLPANPVKAFCSKLPVTTHKPKPLIEELGRALNIYTNYTKQTKCVNITKSSWGGIDDFAWNFQACTEMIMPMCSTKRDMFEEQAWNYTKFSQDCYEVWKVHIARPNLAIREYGGKHLAAASNIIFTNGLMDPWSGGGVLQNVSRSVYAIVMPDTAHHLDLRGYNIADPPSVLNARYHIQVVIRKWIRTYYREYLNMYYH
ncbi:hypothetical protein PPYR_05596 [Photinus pyralis]|uniref:Lysosomal Pro-X carboxypeptidase n=1 Tax=Photinus pyralis TaxID=7054 RepID=A0A5N4AV43_PHOPY|nr:lysosomal Pro-X carboxypeptidase [Photinus pyralis]XP_031336692.1 lysosomal Pro-X carboxypeptidase [Photinus pyralis]XP_031336693.1 lysosomal Pro-X carboxypeptidase [Photinus pyralis]KAB0801242.1 hypothetical protein PPYR_05596 [Photinus pyralis]